MVRQPGTGNETPGISCLAAVEPVPIRPVTVLVQLMAVSMTSFLWRTMNRAPVLARGSNRNLSQMARRVFLLIVFSLSLVACQSTVLVKEVSPDNYSSRVRFIVIHATNTDYAESLSLLTGPGSKVSAHYLIPQRVDDSYPVQGIRVHQLVPEQERAWHAGVSNWQGRENLNAESIGIELVYNPSCDGAEPPNSCLYPAYDPEQIEQLILLVRQLQERYPQIEATAIVGHSDIAPERKIDPGPMFPWQQLYRAGIGAWYDAETARCYQDYFELNPISTATLQQALAAYGYGLEVSGTHDRQTDAVIRAFQAHFRPWRVDGQADTETTAILHALLEKYPGRHSRPTYSISESLAIDAERCQGMT